MNYDILDEHGNVINTIVADPEFVQTHYPGRYREAGSTTPPTDEPGPTGPTVPDAIPMLNARTQMYLAGWLAPWETLLAAMEGPEGDLARIKWASALTVRRDDPLVAVGITALGKTGAEADELFIAAAALNP